MLPSCFQVHPSEPLTDLHWSHLKSLSRENQLPSDLEKQTLAKVEHDIEEYDLAIARLQSAIVSLELQRDVAKDYVSRHQSLLAPIRRLSNDVLVQIFTYICADTRLANEANCTRLPQLYLCEVCKRWRSLVNDSPLLWSTFKMTLYNNEHSISDTTLLNRANLVLTRSGNCPLTINLADYKGVHPASALLFQHADRWLSASVSGHHQHYLSVSSFPQLKHLEFYYELGDIQTVPAMPSLESLMIGQPLAHRPFSLSDFPWKQLKRLVLHVSMASQFASIVSWCVQLEHIALTSGPPTEDPLPPVSIVSQTITSTTLGRWDEGERCENLFSLLQFPQLHTLELVHCDLSGSLSLLQFPQLHTLELNQCDLPDFTCPSITHLSSITNLFLKELRFDRDLLVMLRLLPTVIHLSFRNFHIPQPSEPLLYFFSELHPTDPQSGTLLPRLTHFDMSMRIWGAEIGHGLATAFVGMVKSRVMESRLETRLKSIQFTVLDFCLNHELISSLAYLSKAGIAISIRDGCGFIL